VLRVCPLLQSSSPAPVLLRRAPPRLRTRLPHSRTHVRTHARTPPPPRIHNHAYGGSYNALQKAMKCYDEAKDCASRVKTEGCAAESMTGLGGACRKACKVRWLVVVVRCGAVGCE
jgi:hypothetical protein